jgi:hypothetical protein
MEGRLDTMQHIEAVKSYISVCVDILVERAECHDKTKLQSPEAEVFETASKLDNISYGSHEYRENHHKIISAIEHHYLNNRHHPEHFKEGMDGMNLFDLLEMIVDWKASTERHRFGNILKSLDFNQKRFGYSDSMKKLLLRTIMYIEDNARRTAK